MTNNRIGSIVLQHRNDVTRYGVITFQRMRDDGWMHYTIYWISKTPGYSDWMQQIEWRCDKVKIIDENVHLADLQSAISFRNSRKFKEGYAS
jgi:hypothetical protein